MIPPKYRFSLAKSLEAKVTRDSGSTVVTQQIAVPSDSSIYIDYVPTEGFTWNGGQLIETVSVSTNKGGRPVTLAKPGVYTFDEDVEYIQLYFTGYSEELQSKYDSFVKNGFSGVYTLDYISPVYKKLTKKYAKENGQQFFRKTLEGNIKLIGPDFEKIYNADINQSMLFFIEKLNTSTQEWYEYYRGQFSKTDCKFDFAKKVCEPKLTALDQYSNILDKYENTYDLIKLAPAISKIDLCKRPVLQVYIAGDSTISSYLGGTYWESEVNEPVDDTEALVNKYYFSKLVTVNEFKIEGFTDSQINGIYAGQLDPNQTSTASKSGSYKNNKGATIKISFPTLSSGLGGISVYVDGTHIAGAYFRGSYADLSDANDPFFKAFDGNITLYENGSDTTSPIMGQLNTAICYKVYQRLLCDVDSVSGIMTHDLPADDFVSDNRNYKKCIGISSGQIFYTTGTTTEPTKYGVNDYGEYFINKTIYDETGVRPLPVARSSWANASIWYCYNTSEYMTWERRYRNKYTLKDSYSIGAAIKALLKKIDPSLQHEETTEYSQFLYSSGQVLPAKWNIFYVYITQKTNILKGQYDQAAQKAEITLKDIMNMLRDCFKCYWYIEDNKLKIEHISYFMRGGSYLGKRATQLDFTKLNDQFNKIRANYFQSEIEYDKSELNSRYELNWADDATELFGPVNIDVNVAYVQKDKTEEVAPNKFSADVDFMLLEPSSFSDDGFALLCPIKSGSNLELPIINSKLIDENGRAYDTVVQNYYASWPYLVSFYKFDMPAYSADIDVLATDYTVKEVKRCMNYNIELFAAEDLDELKLITTSLGDGHIEEMSISLDTRLTEVKLSYEPM